MNTCVVCRFETVADDIALAGPHGRPVCIRCYARETGQTLRMPRKLRLALSAILDAAVPEPAANTLQN